MGEKPSYLLLVSTHWKAALSSGRLTLHSKGDKIKAEGMLATAALPSTVARRTQQSLSPVSVSWTVSKASGLDESKFCKDTHLGSLSWERHHIFFLFFPCLSVWVFSSSVGLGSCISLHHLLLFSSLVPWQVAPKVKVQIYFPSPS